MAYEERVFCDKCGTGWRWEGMSLGISFARRDARKEGWQVGKTGWFCPKCRTKKRSKNGKTV